MHADLAAALLRAAQAVYGPVEEVEVLSNEGHSRESLERAIADRIAEWPHGGVILTDFWGGSCHVCGASALRGKGEIVLITGVNLPVLVDYLHNRDLYGPAELADRLKRKGQDSLRIHRGAPA
jgi:PTS system mannose-specific IIA component